MSNDPDRSGEIAISTAGKNHVAVYDTARPEWGARLVVSDRAWTEFLAAVKRGEFDD